MLIYDRQNMTKKNNTHTAYERREREKIRSLRFFKWEKQYGEHLLEFFCCCCLLFYSLCCRWLVSWSMIVHLFLLLLVYCSFSCSRSFIRYVCMGECVALTEYPQQWFYCCDMHDRTRQCCELWKMFAQQSDKHKNLFFLVFLCIFNFAFASIWFFSNNSNKQFIIATIILWDFFKKNNNKQSKRETNCLFIYAFSSFISLFFLPETLSSFIRDLLQFNTVWCVICFIYFRVCAFFFLLLEIQKKLNEKRRNKNIQIMTFNFN